MYAAIRKLRYLFVFILLVFSVPACAAEEPIRVGFIADLTGSNSSLGVDGRDGVLLAMEQINAQGRIQGRHVELVIRDDQGTSQGAVDAAKELIEQEKVFVIIGHTTSSMMLAAWEATKDGGVIYLSPTASAAQLTGSDDNFLRLTPTTSAFAETLAEYAAKELGLKRIAVFYDTDNSAFTSSYLEGFTQQLVSSGGEAVWTHPFSSVSEPDFKTAMPTLQEADSDGVLIIASASDTALIAQQIRLGGLSAQLLTTNWALTRDLIENGGAAVDEMIAVATYNENRQLPKYQQFASDFEKRFGRQPSFSAGYGYDATIVLADALEKSNGKPERLKQALLGTTNFSGVFGNISLDKYGDVRRTLYAVAIHEGKFETVKTFFAP